MKLKLPIKIVSEANQRESWLKKYHRKKAQQREVEIEWKRQIKQKVNLPCKVVFTRHALQMMDSDNLSGGFKHIRDSVARMIGVDDGSDQIEFEYRQEKLAKREYFIEIEVEEK